MSDIGDEGLFLSHNPIRNLCRKHSGFGEKKSGQFEKLTGQKEMLVYQQAAACASVIAAVTTMSSALHPLERSETGFAKPWRIGP